MEYLFDTAYPETAKTFENDRIHLLASDNGSFTVSHKESGRVFFEMPSLLMRKDDTFAFCTHSDISKTRDDDMVTFTSVQKITMPSGKLDPLVLAEQTAVINTVLYDFAGEMTITVNYLPCNNQMILRFPTGMTDAIVGHNVGACIIESLSPSYELTLTDFENNIFRLHIMSAELVKIVVDEAGTIDVYLPSIAPATGENYISVNFVIEFQDET